MANMSDLELLRQIQQTGQIQKSKDTTSESLPKDAIRTLSEGTRSLSHGLDSDKGKNKK